MLLVDRREGSSALTAPLQKRGLSVVETTLEFGDIAFEGRGELGAPVQVGIEFKRLSELVGSMRTGRLEGHQLLGMREAQPGQSPLYDFAYLLVQGEVLYDGRGVLLERKWRYGKPSLEPLHGTMNVFEFKKRMHVLQLRGGLNTLFVRTDEEVLDEIEILYRVWTDKDLDGHTSHLAIYNPPTLIPISDFRRTVSTLPGLGWKLSGVVEKAFHGSLAKAFAADVRQWEAIDGLGPKSAGVIHQAIHGR